MSGSLLAEKQTTLQDEILISGVGLFTGEKCTVRILPAPLNTGWVFQRIDLPDKPLIPARLPFVRESPRTTRLGGEKGSIVMVEHLLSALYAYGVDHVKIEVEGPEIPMGDGSSQYFVAAIEKVGLKSFDMPKKIACVAQPIYWSENDIHLVALPAPEFRLSYTMHYPNSSSALLKSQYYSLSLKPERYREEIARSRTFSLYEEILPFIEKGVIKGGGLENGVVIRGDQILNPEGIRFSDEMVRHKILDLIGDLSLIGCPLQAHVIAVRSGHSSNVAFAKVLSKTLQLENADV